MDYMGEVYFQMKNTVIKYERYLLKELGFCVHVEHPHKLIITYLQILGLEKNVELAQKAWNYMNDGLRTNIFVRFTVKTIACSCVYLAARQIGIPLPRKPAWYLLFKVTLRDIKAICRELLAVYSHRTKPLEELESRIKEIREELQSQKVVEIKEVNVASKKNSPQPPTASSSPLLDLPPDRKSRSKSPLENRLIARPGVSSLVSHSSARDLSHHPVAKGSRKRSRSLSPPTPEPKREKRTSLVPPHSSSHSPQTPPAPLSRQKKLPEAYKHTAISSPIRVSSDNGSDSESITDNSPLGARTQNGLPRAYSSRSHSRQSDTHHRHHQRKHHHHKHRSEKRKHRDSSRSSSRERERRRHRRRHHHTRDLYHSTIPRSNSAHVRHRDKERTRIRKTDSLIYR